MVEYQCSLRKCKICISAAETLIVTDDEVSHSKGRHGSVDQAELVAEVIPRNPVILNMDLPCSDMRGPVP